MEIEVDLDGIPDLERDLRRVEVELSDTSRSAAQKAAKEGLAESIATRRYQDRSGESGLTATAHVHLETSAPGGAVAVIRWPVKYASFVDRGTKPHTIIGNPLAFEWKGAASFFRWVYHPGTRPYGFAGVAYLKAERVLRRELELGVVRAQRILDR